jgi:mono/diheme cytochrome c family protein
VAEVPQRLLDMSKARRALLAGKPAPEATAPAASTEVAVAASAATPATKAAPAGGGGSGAASSPYPVIPASPLAPKGFRFAKMGSVFLLAVTPIWALFMFSAWAKPHVKGDTPAKSGSSLYALNCAGCHNANGSGTEGGGIGRPLWNKNAEKTFPDPAQQLAFIWHGSCEPGTPYGNPAREGGQHAAKGGMPAFAGSLTATQLTYIVAYERASLSGGDWPVDFFAKVGEKPDDARAAKPLDDAALKKQAEESSAKICG